jgi:hypothetical protein
MDLAYRIYKGACKLVFAAVILDLVKVAVALLLSGNIFAVIPGGLIYLLWAYRGTFANLTFTNL